MTLMQTETAPATSAASPMTAVSRKTFFRAIAAAVLIGMGTGAMYTLEGALHLTFNKPPMPLRKQLGQMKKQLGDGPRYEAAGADRAMDEAILEVLGTHDYLLRTYIDKTKTNEPGAALDLNVNYYPTGDATPHVPEICWAGSGLQEAKELRKTFTIPKVRRADGTVQDISMHLISFRVGDVDLLDGSSAKKFKNVAYLFEVNGDCVVTPKEVISSFWKASNKHAYHSKIEVTVEEPCTQEEAEQVISDFIRDALPAVEDCLPEKESPESAAAVTKQ